MLDVGAADAFIIYFAVENDCKKRNYLILVDAGNYNDGDKVIKHIRKFYRNPVIDLAIVSHCDKDHYGGFVRILEKIDNKDTDAVQIKEFWVNDPSQHDVDPDDVQRVQTQGTVDDRLKSVYTLSDKENLLDLIDKLEIKREEKFSKICCRVGLPPVALKDSEYNCFTVIGPTKCYYESQILDMRNNLKAICEASESYSSYSNGSSQYLDDADDDDSAHNQSSIILLFQVNGKKYLFMGDAGEDAYDNLLSQHKALIKDVYWLKVPHHGSDHNLTTDMINYINPYVAYISTERENHYLSQSTIDALNDVGCRVYSTHVHGNMLHNGHREGYTTATPLK